MYMFFKFHLEITARDKSCSVNYPIESPSYIYQTIEYTSSTVSGKRWECYYAVLLRTNKTLDLCSKTMSRFN